MTFSGFSQGDFDLESALAECVNCADAEGGPVCVMIVEGEGVQMPNPCYAACFGFPTVGPWFCASDDGTGGEGETGTDSDEDGLTDQAESEWGTDANDPDTDGDGLTDGEEVTLFGTDPMLIDTDGNGRPDAVDLALDLMSQTQLSAHGRACSVVCQADAPGSET